MELGLKGRKVLITGASQGIGEGLAQAFAAEHCELYLVARSQDKLERVAAQARDAYDVQVHVLPADLTAPGAVDAVMRFAGDAHVLVNNAGSIPGGTLWDIDEGAWRQGWELKVFGYINLTRAMYPAMKQRGGGVILNNIGNGGQNFDFNYIAGTTGNAALMAFTCALGGRSLEDGIRVVGVNPGPVDTDRIRKVMRGHAARMLGDAERYGEMLARYPLGRPATVPEVADLFVYLASDRSAYTSGTILTVDGGITSKRSV
jgi:NAD(P)-dependent dehydrogenase (short-subunit alcohol dehydrogenase family)